MKSITAFLCTLALVALAGCESSRQISSVRDDHTAFAIKGADAKRAIDSALATHIPPERIDHTPRAGITGSGSVQSGAEVQYITITALPVSGVNARGEILEGYGFTVTDSGAVVNDLLPRMIYGLVKQEARGYGEILATARPQQGE